MNCLPTGLTVSKKVLLTGAGFTKDFGGFLASEMWSFIFNSPFLDNHPKIKNILRNDFSYESVYHEVIENTKYNADEKSGIKEAVRSAYEMLDKSIRGYGIKIMNRSAIANSTNVTAFINRFSDAGGNSRSFFFTLNQDLFVERYCRDNGIATPGVTLQGIYQDNDINQDNDAVYQQLPDESRVTEIFDENDSNNPLRSNQLYYVKLHGSYHWKDSAGNAHMVIGEDKTGQISREPLLMCYSKLFDEVLSVGDVELLVIGYGFGDEHINKVIADSVRDHDLGLHIMSPEAPEEFKNDLTKKHNCEGLWDSLRSYYPYNISRVFPQDGSETIEYRQIMNKLFQ